MTSKEWRSHIRSLAPVSRPDDMEEALLRDFAAAEAEAKEWQEVFDDDDPLRSWNTLMERTHAAEADAKRLRDNVAEMLERVVPWLSDSSFDDLSPEAETALAEARLSCDVVKRALAALAPAPQAPDWIPVSEKPESSGRWLIGVMPDRFDIPWPCYWPSNQPWDDFVAASHMTHWQLLPPLPAPPAPVEAPHE